jgi:hypothetical protein
MEGYAIVMDKVMASCAGEFDSGHIELSRGMMVECKRSSDRYSNIAIRDYYQQNHAFENNLYVCKSSALLQVQSSLWPFLIAISDPVDRLALAKDKPFIEYILALDINSFVTVNGQYFHEYTAASRALLLSSEKEQQAAMVLDYQCAVYYIGPVPELGPGHFFGLHYVVIFPVTKAKTRRTFPKFHALLSLSFCLVVW